MKSKAITVLDLEREGWFFIGNVGHRKFSVSGTKFSIEQDPKKGTWRVWRLGETLSPPMRTMEQLEFYMRVLTEPVSFKCDKATGVYQVTFGTTK